jgi:hypothetical protein
MTLTDLPLEGGYFRPLADHPTMAQALWTRVRELRMAGVRSEALKPEVFSSWIKHAELVGGSQFAWMAAVPKRDPSFDTVQAAAAS